MSSRTDQLLPASSLTAQSPGSAVMVSPEAVVHDHLSARRSAVTIPVRRNRFHCRRLRYPSQPASPIKPSMVARTTKGSDRLLGTPLSHVAVCGASTLTATTILTRLDGAIVTGREAVTLAGAAASSLYGRK